MDNINDIAHDVQNRLMDMREEYGDSRNLYYELSSVIGMLDDLCIATDALNCENAALREELASRPRAGRKPKYSDEEKYEIYAYYEKYSYKATVKHFDIPQSTLNDILKEYR